MQDVEGRSSVASEYRETDLRTLVLNETSSVRWNLSRTLYAEEHCADVALPQPAKERTAWKHWRSKDYEALLIVASN